MRPVVVALDAEHTRQSDAGVARYGRSLAAEFRKRDDVSLIELGGGVVVARGTTAKRLLTLRQDFHWYPWAGRRRARLLGADVYHVPIPRGPLARGKPPLVITVHDLVPLLYPETTTPWSRIYSRLTLRKVLDAADRIITPSQKTADDLQSLLKLAADRIRVIHNGVDDIFFGPFAEPAVADAIDGPYVLFVGTPEPRKNLARLIAAMLLLRQRGFDERLVLVGAGGWGAAETESPDGQLVHRIGKVSDVQLRALYQRASCLALPSLHEGFGLTALEAMAVGTPVVASYAGALPEITGGAATLVDPLDTAAIANGIAQCIGTRELHATRGHERAKLFKWSRSAAGTVAVYKELV